MVNLMDAHGPYLPPDHYRGMFGDSLQPINRYDGAIAYLDSLVGGFIEQLRRRGELDRTVIVVTADHGELFGEHGVKGHVESLYRRATRVPLIISGGALPGGIRVQPEISMRDLAATILDIAGSRQHELPGTSLRVAWETGSNRHVSPVIIETPKGKNVSPKARTHDGAIVAAVDSAWYYIRYFNNSEELYWRGDTLETRNMIATPQGREAADRLLEVITEELRDARPPRVTRHAANGRLP
jgi:arylsulfatase A-like enzyme